MKLQTMICVLALGVGAARADFTIVSGLGDIPEGSLIGMVSTGTESGLAGNVTGMTLDLNISGGYNGDLYAYLVAPNGSTALLMDRPGVTGGNPFGYGGSGMNIALGSTGGNIQTTPETPGVQLMGNYQPVVSLTTFNGLAANGNWRLFIADEGSGGGQAVLNNWSLAITATAVPEPDQVAAMVLLGLVGLVAGSWRSWGRGLGVEQYAGKAWGGLAAGWSCCRHWKP